MTQFFKKTLSSKAIIFIIVASFILTSGLVGPYCSSVLASNSLRPPSARIRLDTLGGNPGLGVIIPVIPSNVFRLGYQPEKSVPDDITTETTLSAAMTLSKLGLRGAALSVRQDKAAINTIKNRADAIAKRIFEMLIKQANIILRVRVSEGFGRDEVAESFVANEVIIPDELRGEVTAINEAIASGSEVYTSSAGRKYLIQDAILDVIEGTNAFVFNVDGKALSDMPDFESGGTSVMVSGPGVAALGNCPDIYADGIFTVVPEVKIAEFQSNPLDPELVASDPKNIKGVLMRIASANGIAINDLEVVLMDRAREVEKLGVLKEIQKEYPELQITTIKDGTVAHSLLATFGRKEGKLKVVMTVGGAPEVFMNLAVAGLFKTQGAVGGVRVYSTNVNKTILGQDATSLTRRYAFSKEEREDILTLRPDDGEAIITGQKLFTQQDVKGEVDGSFAFITNNGVFKIAGAEELANGDFRVTVLRVRTISGKPCVWFEEKIISAKDNIALLIPILETEEKLAKDPQEKARITAQLADLKTKEVVLLSQPQLNFPNITAVHEALEGVVEITPLGVEVIDEALLRRRLVDKLVYDATFNPDAAVVNECRKLIKDIAASLGIKLDSVYNLYAQKAKDPRHLTVPAINVRGMAYNTARAIFQSAVDNNAGVFILEIAKSEIGYTQQRPAEYTTSILAAAIKEGYSRPVYLQGDHFQIAMKDYVVNPDNAREAIKKLIREAIEAGFFQIDLDMSVLVDWSKPTADEQQKNNYTETAILTAYVRELEKELGLDKLGITVNLGGEIGEIGMGLEKGKERNSTVEDLRAFMSGYRAILGSLSEKYGYELKPITKIAVQSGTKHGGIRDASGNVVRAKVSFNTLAELGKVAREEYGLAGVVQHGASTLSSENFTLFAGKGVAAGFEVAPELLNEASLKILDEHPVAEAHLATKYQDIILDNSQFPAELREALKAFILGKYPPKEGQDPNKVFVDNRKNVWGAYKNPLWSLPLYIQDAIRASLKGEFDTVFNTLGAKDSGIIIAELNWGRELAPIAEVIHRDLNRPLQPSVLTINSERDKTYPILVHHESLLKETPAGIMFLGNISSQLGSGNIKFVLHIARNDVKPEEVDKIVDDALDAINKINKGYTAITREAFAAIVVGTNPDEISKQVQEKFGTGIYQVIGPADYVAQFKAAPIKIVIDTVVETKLDRKMEAVSMAKALRLSLELIPTEGKLSSEKLRELDELFSQDTEGNFHVKPADVVIEVENKAEEYKTAVAAAEIRV
jgi:hypothetical protein